MSSRRRKHEEHEEHVNHERWLITYADMITLLMVLFIVLFSIGQTDLAKFKKLAGGLEKSFGGSGGPAEPGPVTTSGDGVLDGGKGAYQGDLISANPSLLGAASAALEEKQAHQTAVNQNRAELQRTESQIATQLQAKGLDSAVNLKVDETRGLVVTVVTDQVLFDSGKAGLRSEGSAVLDGITGVLTSMPNKIVVEGHTDNRPISGTFPSNWELSTTRATTVLRYMVDRGVPVTRIQAAGYADQRPIASNDTPEGRATNRRVEIVVLSMVDAPPQ